MSFNPFLTVYNQNYLGEWLSVRGLEGFFDGLQIDLGTRDNDADQGWVVRSRTLIKRRGVI